MGYVPKMASPIDRITQLRVHGLRTLVDLTFDLDGLSVVIGANGAGKTSLVEACALLKKIPSDNFLQQLNEGHGGLGALLRRGYPFLELLGPAKRDG